MRRLERPAIGVRRAVSGLFRQPIGMRRAYFSAGLQYLRPELSLIAVLARLVPDASREDVKAAVAEAVRDTYVRRVTERAGETAGTLSVREMIFLHALVCLKKPDVVVETGVAHGSSAVAILSAMKRVGVGKLHSIDLPMVERNGQIHALEGHYAGERHETTVVPDYGQVGWLVPQELRSRWHLYLGDSLRLLPDVIEDVGTVDIFLHDSLHRYRHMMGEFEIAWPRLANGGVLLADDIFVFGHAAIADFARAVRTRFRCYFGMGIMKKLDAPAAATVVQ